MELFDPSELHKLFVPSQHAHKGQLGKLTIIGGSHLFHGASLWALKVASRIVDMVFYSSVVENNELTKHLKSELYDFIAIPREKITDYIAESDTILIGPGLVRESGRQGDEEPTRDLTKRLIEQFPDKKWVIDAGSLTEIEPEWLTALQGAIITPHGKEFESLKLKIKNEKLKMTLQNAKLEKQVQLFAKEFHCIILLKGQQDIVASPTDCVAVEGGNAGMTKGGTGDALAGLVAALSCKNDVFLAACAGSYINKKAGESLEKRVGFNFNASDLVDEVPKVMHELLKTS